MYLHTQLLFHFSEALHPQQPDAPVPANSQSKQTKKLPPSTSSSHVCYEAEALVEFHDAYTPSNMPVISEHWSLFSFIMFWPEARNNHLGKAFI